jgi:deoxyribonuclease-1
VAVVVLLLSAVAFAEPPSRPFPTFDSAKKVARDAIYANHQTDFYCGCAFQPSGATGGTIDASSCGYQARKNKARGKRLEWEHVMPAYFFGHTRSCWKSGNARCVKDGRKFKGRACCAKVDSTFRRIEADLHNLTPAVGELNGDRSNLSTANSHAELGVPQAFLVTEAVAPAASSRICAAWSSSSLSKDRAVLGAAGVGLF